MLLQNEHRLPGDCDPGNASPSDRVFVMGLWAERSEDGASMRRVMTINGKAWPHTERFTFTVGDRMQWRWLNPTRASHPMYLHGFYFRVDSRGAWAADTVYAKPDRRLAVTELMLPGATNSFMWMPEREGNWLFHCLTGAGETADFEISFPTPGTWRLEVNSQLSGWHIPITLRVRA